jgi:hypothetical protein
MFAIEDDFVGASAVHFSVHKPVQDAPSSLSNAFYVVH